MRYLPTLALVLHLAALAPSAQQQPKGILLVNGSLVDGTGAPARTASIRLRADRIVEVGPSLSPAPGDEVIDIAGLTIAPGFVDPHSHADRGLEDNPVRAPGDAGAHDALVGKMAAARCPVGLLRSIERQGCINYARCRPGSGGRGEGANQAPRPPRPRSRR